MLTALLTDIHANREALSACLAHAEASGAQRYVFLGDYVGYGAEPGWAVDRVRAYVERGAIALLGNHDAAALGQDVGMNDVAEAAIRWTRERVDAEQCNFLRSRPLVAEESDRLFAHASAWKPGEWDYVTESAAARRSFSASAHRTTFCGHTHVPLLFHVAPSGKLASFVPSPGTAIPLLPQRRWLAVVGSVGQPRDGDPAAAYALLDETHNTLTYMRVPYDVAGAAAKIRAAGLPPILSLRLREGF